MVVKNVQMAQKFVQPLFYFFRFCAFEHFFDLVKIFKVTPGSIF